MCFASCVWAEAAADVKTATRVVGRALALSIVGGRRWGRTRTLLLSRCRCHADATDQAFHRKVTRLDPLSLLYS